MGANPRRPCLSTVASASASARASWPPEAVAESVGSYRRPSAGAWCRSPMGGGVRRSTSAPPRVARHVHGRGQGRARLQHRRAAVPGPQRHNQLPGAAVVLWFLTTYGKDLAQNRRAFTVASPAASSLSPMGATAHEHLFVKTVTPCDVG